MRVFLAAEFVPPVSSIVTQAQRLLKSQGGAAFRWTAPEAVHLTLLFLGEVAREQVLPMTLVLTKAAAGRPAFSVSTAGWGAFPSPARARILWLGLADPEGSLARLADVLRGALAPFPVPLEERFFTAHLTLARLQGKGRPVDVRTILSTPPPPRGTHRVEGVILYQSELGTEGAVHTVLARFPLTPLNIP